MRTCKTCKGKGFVFKKDIVFTGKYDHFFGMKLPVTTDGYLKVSCQKCFGKGHR